MSGAKNVSCGSGNTAGEGVIRNELAMEKAALKSIRSLSDKKVRISHAFKSRVAIKDMR